MSYEDLKEHNIFLPEPEWGELDLSTSVSIPLLVAAFALAVVSCVLIVAGGGRMWTWIGAGGFIVFMYSFALISNRGVKRQNRRIEEMHATHGESSEPTI